MTSSIEIGLTLAVLALTAGVVSNSVQVPVGLKYTPALAATLVILAVCLFYRYPAVSLSILLLTAVIVFNRNVRNTMKMVYQPTQGKEAIERRLMNPDETTNWAAVPPTPQTGMYPLPSSPPVVGGLPSTNPPPSQNRGTYGEYTRRRRMHRRRVVVSFRSRVPMMSSTRPTRRIRSWDP